MVDSPCQHDAFVNFHIAQHDIADNGQTGNKECSEQNRVHKGQITQPRQITGNSKVEGNKEQQVAAGNIDPFAIIPEKLRHPGDDDNDRNGCKNTQRVVLGFTLCMQMKPESRTFIPYRLPLPGNRCIEPVNTPFLHAQHFPQTAIALEFGKTVDRHGSKQVDIDIEVLRVEGDLRKMKIGCL